MKTKADLVFIKLLKYLLLFGICSLSITSNAQDFVYQPINPAFGGNFYNYNWLLSSAQAQNTFKEPSESYSRYEKDALVDFEESLNRQILNQVSRVIVSSQFGEEGLQDGYYEMGNYQIDITSDIEGISVSILDVTTGSETTVTIPYY